MIYKAYCLLALLLVVCMRPVEAKKWRVNNTLIAPIQVDFNELLEAVESSSVNSGDTIYVEGSPTDYLGGIEINKRLTIIGPGYFLSQPNLAPTSSSQLSAKIGREGITFGLGSDGTYFTGMEVGINSTSQVVRFERTSNITFTRNRIATISFVAGSAHDDLNICRDIIISRNFICGSILFSTHSLTNNIRISNNLIFFEISVNVNSTTSTIQNGLILNNTLTRQGSITVNGSEIAFNYANGISTFASNISIHDNILNNSTSENEEIVAADPSNVIDPFNDNSFGCSSDNWEFPVQDRSTTVGAYNGADPYYSNNPISPANMPAWPIIYQSEVDPFGDQSINVLFRVRTNN